MKPSTLFTTSTTSSSWKDLANRYADLLNARLTFILPDGTVAGESSQPPDALENHSDRPEIIQALAGQESTQVRYSDTLNNDLLYSAVPIRSGNQIIGAARLAIPLNEVNQGVTAIGSTIFTAGLITTIITIVLAIFLTGFTTRPLRRLTETVLGMSAIDPDTTFEITHLDEVARLEHAFNRLAQSTANPDYRIVRRTWQTAGRVNLNDRWGFNHRSRRDHPIEQPGSAENFQQQRQFRGRPFAD